jgi:hypothetical protein
MVRARKHVVGTCNMHSPPLAASSMCVVGWLRQGARLCTVRGAAAGNAGAYECVISPKSMLLAGLGSVLAVRRA